MKRTLILGAVLGLLASLIGGTRAEAIIGGDYDGDLHPNVAMIVAWQHDTYLGHCTGTLVSDRVVVSAAHCFAPSTWHPDVPDEYTVSFRPSLERTASGGYLVTDYIYAEVFYDPRYDEFAPDQSGNHQTLDQLSFDLGVAILQRPAKTNGYYKTIEPAPVVALGGLDHLATGTRNVYFELVGYGLQREFEPPTAGGEYMDFTRNYAIAPLSSLDAQIIYLQGNPNDARGTGGTCRGDSGGPVFDGDTIVGVHSFGNRDNGFGVCHSLGGAVRLDTNEAREFLGEFIDLP